MEKLFGTDGIRGIAGEPPLTAEFVEKIGIVSADVIARHFLPSQLTGNRRSPPKSAVLVARDTRESGKFIFESLAKGITRMGIDVWDCGVLTTPAVSYLATITDCLAGIVISASHNPFQYNGIKFFSPNGMKLPNGMEDEIEERLASFRRKPMSKRKGRIIPFPDGKERYIQFVKRSIPAGVNFSGIKMVIDCANGSPCEIVPRVFADLGAETTILNNCPDGRNINRNCGSLHVEVIRKFVKESGADLGFAFDGDGDRVLFTDEKGSDLDGDHLMALSAWWMKKEGKLKNDTLVVTSMSNVGLHLAMEKIGVRVVTTRVGDRYVLEAMLKTGAVLGGEQAGHIIFLDHAKTGDGLITALRILYIVKQERKPLSDLVRIMTRAPQVLVNVEVKEKKPFGSLPITSGLIKERESTLGREGRILVRYSGTEPLARIMVEGRDKKQIEKIAREIAEALRRELNE